MAAKKSARRGPPGTGRRASGKNGPQIIHSDGARWTDEAQSLFLDTLAATNNVRQAAERSGFSKEAIYARARRDAEFAEKKAHARAIGCGRIEDALYLAADHILSGKPVPSECPWPNMTVQEAIAIARLNRPAQSGEGRRPAWPARRRTLAEVHESILTKLSAIARQRGLLY
jgi:hypothetical protein